MCPIPPTRRQVAAFTPAARLLWIVAGQKNHCLKPLNTVIGLPATAGKKLKSWWPKHLAPLDSQTGLLLLINIRLLLNKPPTTPPKGDFICFKRTETSSLSGKGFFIEM
jgi:hypothetical protein